MAELVKAEDAKEGGVDTFEGAKGPDPSHVGISFSVRAGLNAEAHAAWQRERGAALGLVGAVTVAPDGLNGAMSGPPVACQRFATELRKTLAPARVTVAAIRPSAEPDLDVNVVPALEDWPFRVDELCVVDAADVGPSYAAPEDWHPPLAVAPKITVDVVDGIMPTTVVA